MSNSFVLFDESSINEWSGAFPVNDGSSVILSAWGLPKHIEHSPDERSGNKKPKNSPFMAIIQKMAFKCGPYPEARLCDADGKFLLPEVEYSFVEDVTGCGGLWHLSACQNLVAITVPGTYRIRLNDVAAAGSIYVTGLSIRNTELHGAYNSIFLS